LNVKGRGVTFSGALEGRDGRLPEKRKNNSDHQSHHAEGRADAFPSLCTGKGDWGKSRPVIRGEGFHASGAPNRKAAEE